LLAAPLALFGKPTFKERIVYPTPMGPIVCHDLDEWSDDPEWKKAAGPWRIVEQTEDGVVVIEREINGVSTVLHELRTEIIKDGKSQLRVCWREERPEDSGMTWEIGGSIDRV
jgi:hypothetical protein